MALLGPSAAAAHHSPAQYDVAREIVVEGTLVEVDWGNPHVYLAVATASADGTPVLQRVEAASVSQLNTLGLERNVLVVGSKVLVRARSHRSGPGRSVLGAEITTSDGMTYPLGGLARMSGTPVTAVRAPGLAGRWAPPVDPLLIPRMMAWPLTPEARAARADVAATYDLSVSCTAPPPPMLTQFPTLRTIEVSAATVVMRFDADGADAVRTIRLDLAAHPDAIAPSRFGHSIGRWEGDTLVVDTVGFTPDRSGTGYGAPSSADKHLVERFTLVDDGARLRYELVLEDPRYLTAPATYEALWNHRPELEFSGVRCDPETARRFLAE